MYIIVYIKAKDFPPFETVMEWKHVLKLSYEWLMKAHGALNQSKPLDVKGFTDLLEEANGSLNEKGDDSSKSSKGKGKSCLNIDNVINRKLKAQLKLAKAWRMKVKKTG